MDAPMKGLRVIDLSQIYNGPYATYLMALAGAEVIKIEPPCGEPLRRRGEVGGAALPFAMLNGCKRSVVLDLKTPEGVKALKELTAGADVIVENYAPGVMDRLGIGSDTLMAANSRLIYASSSGYGRNGPYRSYLAMDLTIQAMCGIMHTTGFPDSPPVKAGPAVADFFAGIHLYGAIVTALYEREHTGVARRVEVAMQDAVYASLSSSLGMNWASSGETRPARTGNRHGGLAESPYNVYPTKDGHIAIICVNESHWRELAKLIGNDEMTSDSRFDTLAGRVAQMDQIDDLVSDWTKSLTSEELFEQMIAVNVPCAPVRTLDQVMNDPNMHERGALEWIEHPELGSIVVQQLPFQFDGVEPVTLTPSRQLGADTDSVMAALKN